MTRASDFLASDLSPSVERWRADETNLGLAKLAAVNLNQMVDHYFHSFPAGDAKLLGAASTGALRSELRSRYPSFALIHDVADAHKHVQLDRPSRQLTSTDQTSVRPLGYGEAEYSGGRYGGPPEVVVELDSGVKRHFSMLVNDTVDMWEQLLA
jgi:hypothetical protein